MTRTKQTQKLNEIAKANIETLAEDERTQVLGSEYTVSMNGDIREIELTLTTGGPLVKVELFNEVVQVVWGSDSTRRVIRDSEAKAECEKLRHQYERLAEF